MSDDKVIWHLFEQAIEQVRDREPEDLKGGGGGGTSGPMDPRIDRLESEMKEVKASLQALLIDSTEIKTLLKHVVTKADLEAAKGSLSDRVSNVEGQAKHMLTFWQFLLVVGGLLAIILKWPELFKLVGATIP